MPCIPLGIIKRFTGFVLRCLLCVACLCTTKWACRITQERCDVESPNVTLISRHGWYDVTSYFWSTAVAIKRLKHGSDGLRRELHATGHDPVWKTTSSQSDVERLQRFLKWIGIAFRLAQPFGGLLVTVIWRMVHTISQYSLVSFSREFKSVEPIVWLWSDDARNHLSAFFQITKSVIENRTQYAGSSSGLMTVVVTILFIVDTDTSNGQLFDVFPLLTQVVLAIWKCKRGGLSQKLSSWY